MQYDSSQNIFSSFRIHFFVSYKLLDLSIKIVFTQNLHLFVIIYFYILYIFSFIHFFLNTSSNLEFFNYRNILSFNHACLFYILIRQIALGSILLYHERRYA